MKQKYLFLIVFLQCVCFFPVVILLTSSEGNSVQALKETALHLFIRKSGFARIARGECRWRKETYQIPDECEAKLSELDQSIQLESTHKSGKYALVYYSGETSSEVYKIGSKNRADYCEKHGYTCVDFSEFTHSVLQLLEDRNSYGCPSSVKKVFALTFEEYINKCTSVSDKIKTQLERWKNHYIFSMSLEEIYSKKTAGRSHMKNPRQMRLMFKTLHLITLMNDIDFNDIEWFLFMDIDALIMAKEKSLDQFLKEMTEYRSHFSQSTLEVSNVFLIGSFEEVNAVNSGQIFLRNSKSAERFVHEWLDRFQTFFRTDQQALNSALNHHTRSWFGEASCVVDEKNLESASSIKICAQFASCLPQIVLVPFCGIAPWGGIGMKENPQFLSLNFIDFKQVFLDGDFAVHFAGREDKARQMKLAAFGSAFFS